MRSFAFIVILGVSTAWPTIGAAQSDTKPPAGFCFRGHPLPTCDRFLLFEFGGSGRAFTTNRVAGSQQVDVAQDGNGFATLDIGFMRNRLDGTALGGTLQIGAGDASRRRLALEVRRRQWLTGRLALDVGAGPLEINTRKAFRPFAAGAGYGLTSHAGLSLMDLITVTTNVDVVSGGRPQLTLMFGGRFGSFPAVGAAVLGALLAAAAQGVTDS